MNKSLKKRLFAAAAAVTVIAGIAVIQASYRNGQAFSPNIYGQEREFQDNQVVFPGEDSYDPMQEDQSGRSDLWEQNFESDERLKPDEIPDSDYLFSAKGQSRDGRHPQQVILGDQTQDYPDGDPDGAIVVNPNGQGDTTVIVPESGGGSSIETVKGEGGQGQDHSGGKTEEGGSKAEDGTDGGSAGEGGETVEPDPRPDPSDVPDPDPVVPEDIFADDPWIESEQFQEGGFTNIPDGGNQPADGYELMIVGGADSLYEAEVYRFYAGETVTPEKVLASSCFYIQDLSNPLHLYHLTEYNDCFQLADYPALAQDDSFEVTLMFRPNTSYAWSEVRCSITVWPYKLMLLRKDGERPVEIFLRSKETANLADYYYKMLPEEISGSYPYNAPAELDEIFPGWSEIPGGPIAGPVYMPAQTGRTVLYPNRLQKVAQGYRVQLVGYYGQTVVELPQTENAMWDIMPGIQTVMPGAGRKSIGRSIYIPSSVRSIDTAYFAVTDSYQADENSLYYKTVDGVLYSADQSAVIGIPLSKTELTVPESVSEIALPEGGALKKVVFQSDQPPKADPSVLKEAGIFVPAEAAARYLMAWQALLGEGTRMYIAGQTDDNGNPVEVGLIRENGLVLSADRTVLYSIENISGVCRLPDTVETVKSGALEQCSELAVLVLPAGIKTLESGSLAGPALERVLLCGSIPPAIEPDTFGACVEACVKPEALDTYRECWQSVCEPAASDFEFIQDASGWSLLKEIQDGVEKVTLLKAPDDITAFDGMSEPGTVLTDIGSYAFSQCRQLVWADLPRSIRSVGRHAFYNCEKLEGVYSAAADSLTVSDLAFYINDGLFGEGKLRFLAFNAKSAVFKDGYTPYVSCYAPESAEGYPGSFTHMAGYELKRMGDGVLLYSTPQLWRYSDDCPEEVMGRCLLSATTDISGELDLENSTVIIAADAFRSCVQPFTVINAQNLWEIRGYGFMGAGVAGPLYLPSIYRIGDGAFSMCSGLTEVSFGDTGRLEYIGLGAFSETGLTWFELPETVSELGTGLFDECANLTRVIIKGMIPPTLVSYSYGDPFSFGYNLDAAFRLELAGAAAGREEEYAAAWGYRMAGYQDKESAPEAERLAGEELVRKLFGMHQISAGSGETASACEPIISDNSEEDGT